MKIATKCLIGCGETDKSNKHSVCEDHWYPFLLQKFTILPFANGGPQTIATAHNTNA